MTTTISPYNFWKSNNSISAGWYSSPTTVTVFPTNAANISQTATFVSLKNVSLGSYTYTLAWSLQLNFKAAQAANNIVQQWIQYKWVTADASQYVASICSNTYSTTAVGSPAAPVLRTGTTDLLAFGAGKTAATILTAGTPLVDDNIKLSNTAVDTADTNGFFYHYCQGYRPSTDTTAGVTTFKVGDSVRYITGFRQFASSNATTTLATSTPVTDMTYVVLDGALAIAVSAATAIAVSTQLF
jgi:hypothetical protein